MRSFTFHLLKISLYTSKMTKKVIDATGVKALIVGMSKRKAKSVVVVRCGRCYITASCRLCRLLNKFPPLLFTGLCICVCACARVCMQVKDCACWRRRIADAGHHVTVTSSTISALYWWTACLAVSLFTYLFTYLLFPLTRYSPQIVVASSEVSAQFWWCLLGTKVYQVCNIYGETRIAWRKIVTRRQYDAIITVFGEDL